MTGTELLPLVLDGFRAMMSFYRADLNRLRQEIGLEDFDAPVVAWARGFEPAPITVDGLLSFNPYDPPEVLDTVLVDAASRGFLTQVADGEYRLTDKGRQAQERDQEEVASLLASVETSLSDAELERLLAFLHRVVDSAASAAEPAQKHAFTLNRNLDPGDDAHVLVRIQQYLFDMFRFRDDAHIASWQHIGVSGVLWETFSDLWKGRAVAEARQQIEENREYPQGTFARVLEELTEIGWGEPDGEGYRITEKGKRVRQESEERTDRYFDEPWICLSEDERHELATLLKRLIASFEGSQS